MNDAEFEAQKARIQALAEQWLPPLGLTWWNIALEYARDNYDGRDGAQPTVAYCKADWRYVHARIVWNMPLVAEQDDAELERIFVHECMHIFLHEMRWAETRDTDSLDHEERVATMLTKAFLWLRESLHPMAKGEEHGANP